MSPEEAKRKRNEFLDAQIEVEDALADALKKVRSWVQKFGEPGRDMGLIEGIENLRTVFDRTRADVPCPCCGRRPHRISAEIHTANGRL